MLSMTLLKIVSISLFAALVGVWTFGGSEDLDQRIPVGPGGSLDVAIALGDGISFDHGSLQIRSHTDDDVRVRAETSGWGGYAVALELSHDDAAQHVALVGKVEGALHWMFGGPTLDVEIWLPRRFTVNASIEGGPLVLEELVGPITARVGSTDVTVRGTEGPVRLISERGTVEVEDVRGDLRVESGRGDVEVVGVRGSLHIETGRGRVDVESVTGPVHVRTQRGRVNIEHVRGDIDVETVRARVEIEDIEGRVSAVVARADIEIEKLKGAVLARSTRGSIEVEFSGAPLGEIETERGDILVEVPRGAGFDLAAHTARGRIEIGDGEHGWESFDERDFGRWREQWKSRYADDRWEHGWKGIGSWRERVKRRFAEHTGESARAGEDPQTRAGVVAEERVEAKGRERSVVRSINGGGQRLSLRTARGSIRVVQ